MGRENFTTEDTKQKIKKSAICASSNLDNFLTILLHFFPVHFTFGSSETTLRTLQLKLNL